jgi:hypothetical protein
MIDAVGPYLFMFRLIIYLRRVNLDHSFLSTINPNHFTINYNINIIKSCTKSIFMLTSLFIACTQKSNRGFYMCEQLVKLQPP